jgi:hypothetical protein
MMCKGFPNQSINIAHKEIRDAMQHVINTGSAIDNKVKYTMNTVLFAYIISMFLMKWNFPIFGAWVVLVFGMTVAFFLLMLASKKKTSHIFGDLLEDIHEEPAYYHDTKGIKIYIIERYKNKIMHNIERNSYKINKLNQAQFTIFLSMIIAFLVQIPGLLF